MYPEMLQAIQCIRAEGIKTAALTNNIYVSPTETYCPIQRELFDIVSILMYYKFIIDYTFNFSKFTKIKNHFS